MARVRSISPPTLICLLIATAAVGSAGPAPAALSPSSPECFERTEFRTVSPTARAGTPVLRPEPAGNPSGPGRPLSAWRGDRNVCRFMLVLPAHPVRALVHGSPERQPVRTEGRAPAKRPKIRLYRIGGAEGPRLPASLELPLPRLDRRHPSALDHQDRLVGREPRARYPPWSRPRLACVAPTAAGWRGPPTSAPDSEAAARCPCRPPR